MKKTLVEKIRKYRKTLLIKRKLLFINMIIAILPVTIFGILMTKVYRDTVNKRTRQSVEDSSTVIADRITRVLKDTENCSNYLTVNINKVMENKDINREMSLAEQKAITNELYVAKIVFDEIESIAFISNNGTVFVSDNTIQININEILQSSHLKKLKETSGKPIWFPCETRNFFVQDTTEPVLSLGKKVVKITTGETLGYIFVNVDLRAIGTILSNQLINYRLVDKNEMVISSVTSSEYIDEEEVTELLRQGEMEQITRYNGRSYYISNYEIADYGWSLAGVTDLNEFSVEAKKLLYMAIIIIIAVMVLEILLSYYLSKIITNPLQKLKAGAEEIAGGNMNLRLDFKSEDEIGQLGNSFNYMTEQVQELLVKVDYEAGKKQEYELSLLHEQIKPHFLYNSLDIILKLSDMNRNREARRAIRRLADYYRNSLSDSKKIITISREVKIVEDYLELQRIRYQDIFSYEVDLDESIMNMLIPKLTLQPLIENAIYHGLKYKEEMGLLRVTGNRTERGIVLSVEDNGAGMSPEISQSILTNQPDGHFGVYSVNHRIKLFFGEQYGMAIQSKTGEGTIISILLPAKESMEDGN
ncbi:cache domain-containing sensor histidine kinase [Anaeromicropila populeti]|uniref:Two-component system, sensor histidine kinase YesM n=1 Tax=Anaeromicropila populeti TaxID=37658 RepID=A0A1I6IPZ7_9FIRM|nr:histidine kinase [Anaeromicropila populeti]SFR68825.1 two-component system, sensor histidine kinase YesM [Anaeromicropila populeti]